MLISNPIRLGDFERNRGFQFPIYAHTSSSLIRVNAKIPSPRLPFPFIQSSGSIYCYHAPECIRTSSSAQRDCVDLISRLRIADPLPPYRAVCFGTETGSRLQCACGLHMDHLHSGMLHQPRMGAIYLESGRLGFRGITTVQDKTKVV